jgi:hypothetical protein
MNSNLTVLPLLIGKLRPDGVVTQIPQQRLKAGRALTEKVNETHKHKRRVINPCIGEAVAMLGQVEEFKEVRAQIAVMQAIENATPAEKWSLDCKAS